jgi:ketosteroid isomerase-like protein
MDLEQANKKRVEDFIALLMNGDAEGIAEVYDDEGTCWTSGNTLISGTMNKAQIVAGADMVLGAFPKGLEFTIHAMTAEGERVAVEAESRGEHVSGKIYNNLYHFLFEFKNGRLLKLKEYMDTELVTLILCEGKKPQSAKTPP